MRQLDIYKSMFLTRAMDEEAIILQKRGYIDLWLSCQGQECFQIALEKAVGKETFIFPSYREHALAFSRGIKPYEIAAQWAGQTYCGWNPWEHNFFPYTLVLASQCLHAVGFSIGRKLQNLNATTIVCIGDGATSQGEFSESLNLAAVERAPVIFFCQDNGWAISKSSHEQMRTSIADRAMGFGVEATELVSFDIDSTLKKFEEIYTYVTQEKVPFLIHVKTQRIMGHSSADDQKLYRSNSDIEKSIQNDPLGKLTELLKSEKILTEDLLEALKNDALILRKNFRDNIIDKNA